VKRRLTLLGSTGSIGCSALDVVRHLPGRFEIVALAAGRSVARICEQAREFKPALVILTDYDACREARGRLGSRFNVEWGPAALIDAARTADTTVMAMSGTQGLLPVLAALEDGKTVALATKEILVGYGEHVMRLAAKHGGTVLPIDSELSAVHQCLSAKARSPESKVRSPDVSNVRRVILTASGGPFWRKGLPARATVKDVLRHPTWNMGRKITVDSATMMNKGLEVIETCRLFGLRADQVETVIHPQSIVHSLVEFKDGSILAQLSHPDMRLPLQYCLTWPERKPSLVRALSLHEVGRLDFHFVRHSNFPCLALAYKALASGQAATCALNAANQVSVEAFLEGGIAFGAIPAVISRVLRALPARPARPSVARLLSIEAWATRAARRIAAGTRTGLSRRKE
jgi:1-deoxy-D-xylulose-5-phosphate reductoisomerase